MEMRANSDQILKILKTYLWILIIPAVACSKSITLTRLAPAEINVPTHIQRIVLVDRTEPENKNLALIEGILSGETPFEVKNAVDATLSTLHQELNTSPRYQVIRARERLSGGLFAQVMPVPMTWQQIDALCAQYNADGVLAIERFTSDFVITDKKATIKKTIGSGKDAKVIEVDGIYVEGVASVGTGFRFYDKVNRNIIDQQDYSKTNIWSAEAETRTQAVLLLIDKARATQIVGKMAGASYSRRVAPMLVTLTRTMYSKPKSNFALLKGSRFAEVNKWEEAIGEWEAGLAYASTKEAGRLCYNIALGKEIMGDFYAAQDWAGRAYAYHNFKPGKSYARMLSSRIMEEELVQRQLARD
jgi:hypothetical protein